MTNNNCGDVQKSFVKVDKPSASNTINSGIVITDHAADKIKHFLKIDKKSFKTHCLAIAVQKDGCSGMSYKMDMASILDCQKSEHKRFDHKGAVVMIAKTSYLFVIGSVLDYIEALTGSGFTLSNPNAKKHCSCGASFGI